MSDGSGAERPLEYGYRADIGITTYRARNILYRLMWLAHKHVMVIMHCTMSNALRDASLALGIKDLKVGAMS